MSRIPSNRKIYTMKLVIFQHKPGVQQSYHSSHQPPGGGKICSEIDKIHN